MIELTEQQQQALQERSEQPPRVVNPATKETFVLVPEAVYEKMQSRLGDEDLRELEPLLAELAPEDWQCHPDQHHRGDDYQEHRPRCC